MNPNNPSWGFQEFIIVAVILAAVIGAVIFFVRSRGASAQVARLTNPAEGIKSAPAPEPSRRQVPATRPARQTDIFLSYASSDRSTAQRLANALSNAGWSVWWDRTIPAGKVFDQVIEAALDSARCVVVLWSRASVSSDWVKVEAAEGARRRILVPVLIESVSIPLEFRRIQAADLVNWRGSASESDFEALARSIEALLGGAEPMTGSL